MKTPAEAALETNNFEQAYTLALDSVNSTKPKIRDHVVLVKLYFQGLKKPPGASQSTAAQTGRDAVEKIFTTYKPSDQGVQTIIVELIDFLDSLRKKTTDESDKRIISYSLIKIIDYIYETIKRDKEKNSLRLKWVDCFKQLLNTPYMNIILSDYLNNFEKRSMMLLDNDIVRALNQVDAQTNPQTKFLLYCLALLYCHKSKRDNLAIGKIHYSKEVILVEVSNNFEEQLLREPFDFPFMILLIAIARKTKININCDGLLQKLSDLSSLSSEETSVLFELSTYYASSNQAERAAKLFFDLLQNSTARSVTHGQYHQEMRQHLSPAQLTNLDELLKPAAAQQLIENLNDMDESAQCEKLMLASQQGNLPCLAELIKQVSKDPPNYYAAISIYKLIAIFGNSSSDTTENSQMEKMRKALLGITIKNKKTGKKIKISTFDKLRNYLINIIDQAYNKKPRLPGIYYEMGRLRYEGEVFHQNFFLAYQFFVAAARENDVRASYYLGRMLYYGEGVQQDLREARLRLNDSLQQGQTLNVYQQSEINYLLAEIHNCEYLDLKKSNSENAAQELLNAVNYLLESLSLLKRANIEIRATNKSLLALKIIRETNEFDEKTTCEIDGFIPVASTTHSTSDSSSPTGVNLFDALHQPYSSAIENTIAQLTQIYRANTNGSLTILAKLCYVSHRYSPETPYLNNLHRLLHAVDAGNKVIHLHEHLTSENLKDYYEQLQRFETTQGNYFDEDLTDISDTEEDTQRQGSDRRLTQSKARADAIIKELRTTVLGELTKISRLKHISDEQYATHAARLKSAFSSINPFAVQQRLPESRKKSDIASDIDTLNHYMSQGKLAEGLQQVAGDYVVAFVRGHHFNTKHWNQTSRRKVRKMCTDESHPLLGNNVSMFSSSVYKHAGINDFTDVSPTTQLKLEQSARHLTSRIKRELIDKEEAFSDTELDELNDPCTKKTLLGIKKTERLRKYKQIQGLYSNHYDRFHQFLAWESSRPNPTFINDENPFCSFARLGSLHASWYAFGLKYYDEAQEKSRLRPCYDKNLRPHRHVSGEVRLGLFPIADLATEIYQDVIAMVSNDSIHVSETILREQEFSFVSGIKSQRIVNIDLAKYPDFSRSHLSIDLVKYFMSKELFDKFKDSLRNTKPHEPKQRLILLLLGAYLSAAQNMFLVREAQELATNEKKVLLYLNRHGTFSIKPVFDISPTPNGDSEIKTARRQYTGLRKLGLFSQSDSIDANLDNNEYDDQYQEYEEEEELMSGEVQKAKRAKLTLDDSEEESIAASPIPTA